MALLTTEDVLNKKFQYVKFREGYDQVEVDEFLDEVVANPASYGLANVTERCYTGDDITFNGSGDVCPTPSSYLFWDGIHPTATGHACFSCE